MEEKLVSAIVEEINISNICSVQGYRPSFLTRNVKTFISTSQEQTMGITTSAPEKFRSKRPFKRSSTSSDMESLNTRPAKRVKRHHLSSTTRLKSVQPLQTGATRASLSKIFRLQEPPLQPLCSLCIQGVAIEGDGLSPLLNIPCILRVAFYASDDEAMHWEEVGKWKYKGNLCSFTDATGTSLRFSRKRGAIHIPAEEIYVNRLKNRYDDYYCVRDFADDYKLKIWVEPRVEHGGDLGHWPLVQMPSTVRDEVAAGIMRKHDIKLVCTHERILDLARPARQNIRVCSTGRSEALTSSTLKVDLRWALPNRLSETVVPVRNKTDSNQSQMLFGKTALSQARNGGILPELSSRPHRTARGKRKSPTRVIPPRNYDIAVSYKFIHRQNGIKKDIEVPGLTCVFCKSNYTTLEQLKLHLSIRHPMWRFKSDRVKPPHRFVLTHALGSQLNHETNVQKNTIQLGRPMTFLKTGAVLGSDGVDSWVRAREGPEHVSDTVNLSSSTCSTLNSPITTDHAYDTTTNQGVAIIPKELGKHFIPDVGLPCYDLLTRRRLKVGEEFASSEVEAEESWLHQRVRDSILDFSNFGANGKEYANKWNPFMMTKQITTDIYLPDAILEFVVENQAWFSQKASRKMEFLKHMRIYRLRQILSERKLEQLTNLLDAAENENRLQRSAGAVEKKEGEDEEKSTLPHEQRGITDCECCKLIRPAERVICKSSTCKARFYHHQCAEMQGRPVGRTWLCNQCLCLEKT